ncbi:MAG: P-II family nitrogen regulator [Methanomassiliicoccales archaeon]
MKRVEAIIRNEKLEEVKEALEQVGIIGMTITEVQGRGRQKGYQRQWRGVIYVADLVPKIKIEAVVGEEMLETVIDTILKSAWTGETGDGKIFVMPVEQVIRDRTGERGRDAI